ncbi:MAG: hypothetical protein KJZ91_10720 [Myxococcales bacterium]|nr:hypothetical protein [Myxococcales bacterium]
MAKTESTAVTRLIELAQQRPVAVDLDWFQPPRPRRLPREEVTQVVRVARRVVASPAAVLGAFVAGMLTVAITTLVVRTSPPPTPAPALTAAPATVVEPALASASAVELSPTTVVAPAPDPAPAVAPASDPDPDPAPAIVVTPDPVTVVASAPAASAPAAPARAPAPRAPPTPAAEPRPTRRAAAISGRPRPRPPAAAPTSPGLAELRINSKPPCELYVDGRRIGWTPQRGIAVAPGRRTIVFRNREHGVERKVLVDVEAGQVHRLIRDFTEP